ncbi:MAG TPA: DUF1190 domain-containing protein [Alphaproteobacteria bacterium]|nr:DUF1190 domain-containing protein [Alphaproteobacteria bacterium]
MKKSRTVKLALLGGASLALAACDDNSGPPNDARYFADAKECAAIYDDASCRESARASEQTHLAQAPKFGRKEECEQEFGAGNCETRQSAGGGSYFMPLLMGYMMGNMMGGNRFNEPVYRDRQGNAVMNSGGRAYNVGSFGATAGRTAASFRPAAPTQIARGGFGAGAAKFGSIGS